MASSKAMTPADSADVSAYNQALELMRNDEYPSLNDSIYLDHAGATLCSKSLMNRFATEMTTVLYGNPHSASPSSQLSTSRIENIRLRLLSLFHADPRNFDLVFVANATAGLKLVVEGFRTQPKGFCYAYHQGCHTSLVGIREEAKHSICLNDKEFESWIRNGSPPTVSEAKLPTLVAYPAQSHMDGKRYPLTWSKELRKKNPNDSSSGPLLTILDAASYAATSPLNFDDASLAPDFTVLSLYKIFGFPDLGALIVRRQAGHIFDYRRYFGGGTVDMAICGKEPWHISKSGSLHQRLEDGTLPFHNIIALDIAMTVHNNLFGSMGQVRAHTENLAGYLQSHLESLRHSNGQPVCAIYSNRPDRDSISALTGGPIVCFNLRNSSGAWVSLTEFEKLATINKVHVRTGGMCSPGGIQATLNLEAWEMKRNYSTGFRCGSENDIISGKPTGVIRASMGAMSTMSDVEQFLSFIQEFFVESTTLERLKDPPKPGAIGQANILQVKSITVYPIKSCGGYAVPADLTWEIRPEGLVWDREWCLVHAGTGQALNQKRYPKMALLKPFFDFENGLLQVKYQGPLAKPASREITVPLSTEPSLFNAHDPGIPSRVCGDNILALSYKSTEIHAFFSNVLSVPCILSRFPPGGQGLGTRSSKAQMQTHQIQRGLRRIPGAFPELPSPPDSDSEQLGEAKILLSNESPILMIHSASVQALNKEITNRGGSEIEDTSFRANIVICASDPNENLPSFSEDMWRALRIGKHEFRLLGACHRCQMVCVNQATGERRQEPFSTLAKTRRLNGKVYFGSHMRFAGSSHEISTTKRPAIQTGDAVSVDWTK